MKLLSGICGNVDMDSVTYVYPNGPWKLSTSAGGSEYPEYSDCGTTDAVITMTYFGAAPMAGFAPLLVQFADSTCPVPVSWLWHFGDGNSSILQNPGHVYQLPGTYSPAVDCLQCAV